MRKSQTVAKDVMVLRNRIREIRESRGETLLDVAIATRINPSRLGNIETGKTKSPGIETVMKVARHFGVSMNDLIVQDWMESK